MRAKRKDANHNPVQEHLEKLGWSVADTSALGYGFPDLVVSRPGFTVVIEIKDGSKCPSDRKLTPAEETFKKNWTGPYVLALDPEDAAKQLNALYAQWFWSPA